MEIQRQKDKVRALYVNTDLIEEETQEYKGQLWLKINIFIKRYMISIDSRKTFS